MYIPNNPGPSRVGLCGNQLELFFIHTQHLSLVKYNNDMHMQHIYRVLHTSVVAEVFLTVKSHTEGRIFLFQLRRDCTGAPPSCTP